MHLQGFIALDILKSILNVHGAETAASCDVLSAYLSVCAKYDEEYVGG